MAYTSLSQINISWTPPLRPNGVIIAYEVSYRPTDSSDPDTRLNTTDLETSFSTQSDLDEVIFTVRAYTRVGPGNTSYIIVSIPSEESKILSNTTCSVTHESNSGQKGSFILLVLVGATAVVTVVLCVCIMSVLTHICRLQFLISF